MTWNAFIYIMASPSGTLYTDVTNNLERRVFEHKTKRNKGFTYKYGCTRLVYYEEIGDIVEAIRREKQIKGLLRKKKEALIRSINPTWLDLAQNLFN
ncbi:GIY-YIG nuclease family protein [Candidatus Uhrbacteria bacterium]|nr:GIY-YIG nuclease family protein [Candidatus Uhrbacteria bacterium]MBD3284125.1 GIY-YIG nuclease family protein [Candidatus Uhrbacteria bacterium]